MDLLEMTKIDLETRARNKQHITKEDIKNGLRELGLKRGDHVGGHSSLSSFGYGYGPYPDFGEMEEICIKHDIMME